MHKKKIDITFTRTKKTMKKYLQAIKSFNSGKKKPFEGAFENPIKEFKYWVIIPNEFPYDAIAEENHLLFTKRKVEFDWDKLTKEELEELNQLKKTYLNKHYDVLWENLPKAQSIPGHFHLQLLKLKRERIPDDFFDSD